MIARVGKVCVVAHIASCVVYRTNDARCLDYARKLQRLRRGRRSTHAEAWLMGAFEAVAGGTEADSDLIKKSQRNLKCARA